MPNNERHPSRDVETRRGFIDGGAPLSSSLSSPPRLVLLSTLPDPNCADAQFVTDSFNSPGTSTAGSTTNTSGPENATTIKSPVDLSYCFHRDNIFTAASSYIVQSESTASRTIVNYNPLDEMTVDEFQRVVTSLINTDSTQYMKELWFHFEGRIPDTTLQCISWLRTAFSSSSSLQFTISVECEKPQRPGLSDLASHADVVFYSRSWAEGQGYGSARECLMGESRRIAATDWARRSNTAEEAHLESLTTASRSVTLCCTWGSDGASAVKLDLDSIRVRHDLLRVETLPSWRPYSPPDQTGVQVIDTIGAGDTWIAGMLFALTSRPWWYFSKCIEFANELAGRKVLRNGFDGLGDEMTSTMWM